MHSPELGLNPGSSARGYSAQRHGRPDTSASTVFIAGFVGPWIRTRIISMQEHLVWPRYA